MHWQLGSAWLAETTVTTAAARRPHNQFERSPVPHTPLHSTRFAGNALCMALISLIYLLFICPGPV